jgi:dolichol-phosphate mannosyltransferase
MVAPLTAGEADLTVASRLVRQKDERPVNALVRTMAKLARTATGTTDPLSGLIALKKSLIDEVGHHFHAVGRQFSFELLAKVGGNWLDVPVHTERARRCPMRRPGFDDLRHLKHLADHRFGNFSRLVQFCTVGGIGMVVDLTFYAFFQFVFNRTPLANYVVPPTKVTVADTCSGALAIAIALVCNFILNRRLTFSYARRGSIARQFITYAASNALSVALSLALRLGLPRKVVFFSHHRLAAAVVGIVAATAVSFSMSRWVVFRRHPAPQPRGPFSEPEAKPHEPADGQHAGSMSAKREVLMDKAG